MSRRAAHEIVAAVEAAPDLLLCVASGATPSRAYGFLAKHRQVFERARVIKLDEWGGLAMDDPASSETQIRREIVEPLAIGEDRYTAFRGDAADPLAECERIRSFVDDAGPIGLSVLGLGVNGHVGFNEPARDLSLRPHVATLSEASLSHSMLAVAEGIALHGLTLGIGDLMWSRRVLLLVSGPVKQAALRRLVEGDITSEFPASILRLHPDALCLCDASAAAGLSRRT